MQRIRATMRGDRRAVPRGGRRRSDAEAHRGWVPALWITAAVVALDWATKALVTNTITRGSFRELVRGRVAVWYVRNDAMMLGLWGDLPLASRRTIAAGGAVLAALFLTQILGRGHRFSARERPWTWAYVGLALGGMMGNLGERAIHWGVTDWLSLRWGRVWLPPGNFADLALFLSIPLALPVVTFEVMGRTRRTAADVACLHEPPAAPEPSSS